MEPSSVAPSKINSCDQSAHPNPMVTPNPSVGHRTVWPGWKHSKNSQSAFKMPPGHNTGTKGVKLEKDDGFGWWWEASETDLLKLKLGNFWKKQPRGKTKPLRVVVKFWWRLQKIYIYIYTSPWACVYWWCPTQLHLVSSMWLDLFVGFDILLLTAFVGGKTSKLPKFFQRHSWALHTSCG